MQVMFHFDKNIVYPFPRILKNSVCSLLLKHNNISYRISFHATIFFNVELLSCKVSFHEKISLSNILSFKSIIHVHEQNFCSIKSIERLSIQFSKYFLQASSLEMRVLFIHIKLSIRILEKHSYKNENA